MVPDYLGDIFCRNFCVVVRVELVFGIIVCRCGDELISAF